MLKLKSVLFVTAFLTGSTAFAGRNAPSNKGIEFQVSGGTSQLDQTMATEHLEHPPAFFLAGRWHKSIFQAGVCYLGIFHKDDTGASPAGQSPNPNERDAYESFTLTSACAGFNFGNILMIEGGYGYAAFSREESMPFAGTAQRSTYNANGLGWLAGGSLIPIHFNRFGLGVTGYYFDATATDYSSDVVNGATETIKGSGNGAVHSFGWYTGASLFFNF